MGEKTIGRAEHPARTAQAQRIGSGPLRMATDPPQMLAIGMMPRVKNLLLAITVPRIDDSHNWGMIPAPATEERINAKAQPNEEAANQVNAFPGRIVANGCRLTAGMQRSVAVILSRPIPKRSRSLGAARPAIKPPNAPKIPRTANVAG